jgi:ABC-type multidrug transport system fused ATPase/permease subunit
MSHVSNRERGGLGALYRAMWRYAAGDRWRLVLFMAMLAGAALVKLAIPYYTGAAVTAVQASDLAAAGRDMALIFGVALVAWALHGPGRTIERAVGLGLRERYADALYGKATRLPLSWHEYNHSGSTIRRIDKSGAALYGFAEHQFVYLQNFISLVGPLVALFLISVPTGMTALLGYSLIAVVLVRFDRVMLRFNRVQNRAERRYGAALVDGLGNVGTVLALRLEGPVRRHLARRMSAIFAPLRRNIVMNETKWFVVDILNNAIRCGLAVLYVWLAFRHGGALVLGNAVMVFQYAQQAGGVVSNMAGNYQDLVTWEGDLGLAAPLLAAAEPVRQEASVPEHWRTIRVEGLSFAYGGGRSENGIASLDLTLDRGARIALVGDSGAGKTTLLRVLAGLYPPDAGCFAIDGQIAPLTHLGSIATLVPQDPEIFAGTIGHNITLGVEHSFEDIGQACDIAGFSPVLARLPFGLATNIAERGVNLSGGQKQRLSVARGILAARSSSLLLLDEPTSSLDPKTEARVYETLLAAFPDACIVSAIHRLHLLPRFDAVAFMADGRIAAFGTVDHVMAAEPRFRTLVAHYATRDGRPIAA